MSFSLFLRQGSRLCGPSQIRHHILGSSRVCFSNGNCRGLILQSSLLRPHLSQILRKTMMTGNYAQKWKLEKLLTIIMFPVLPMTFSNPGTEILDNLFAILVTTHAHFGLSAIARDYVRPIIFGPVVPKIAVGFVYCLTATTLAGLLYFNHHNVGIGAAGRQIWSIGKGNQEAA